MKNILVVFGGRSAEHDISIITAHVPIISALKAAGNYNVVPLYLAKNGGWYSTPELNDLETFRKSDFEGWLAKQSKIELSFNQGLTIVWPGLRAKRVAIDLVFPALHGTYGEDGSLMGTLRMAGVPFVGCDMEASVIAMNKVLAHEVLAANNLPVVPHVWFTKQQWVADPAPYLQAISQLKYPLFVKPPHLGSSIGITKVEDPKDLENAIEVALHYDDRCTVEQGVTNLIEVTLPIMGNHEPILAQVEQPLAEFFDFDKKYLHGSKKGQSQTSSPYSKIPADISPELMSRVQELGLATYRAIGASGIARIDFLIDAKTSTVYVNEINTLPGSLYMHNWKQSGWTSVALVEKLIALAEERAAETSQLTYVFSSTALNHVGGGKSHS